MTSVVFCLIVAQVIGNVGVSARGIVRRSIDGYVIPALGELINIVGQRFIDSLGSGTYSISQPGLNQMWITRVGNGSVTSCYYHPTKIHSASTRGKVGIKKSVARAGHWACSSQTVALWGNQAYWNDNP
jgi:muramidase (phage lysozyme)